MKVNRKIVYLLLVIVAINAFRPPFSPSPSFPTFYLPTVSSSELQTSKVAREFRISNDMFWKENNTYQIIGGDVHYFRVLPEYWKDRLLRAKALGLNAIQTYVPWNLHEPQPEKWIFEGIANIEAFLKLAHELGFLVMLRPGPYICGEWDFGGFPAWLLSIDPPLRLRSSDPSYLKLVDRWWGVLLPKIKPFLYSNHGPIVMIQIENEYGSYGEDKSYLQHLTSLARFHLGENIILYTTDGGTRETLQKGSLQSPDVFSAVDFSTGDDPWPIFELQKEFNAPGKSPPLATEFYTGWLTHWGENLAKTGAIFTATSLEQILSRNGSVVLYMAHGGSNFGFYSGANTGQTASEYKPDLTSYDYDAPIRESGDIDNLKFKAIRKVIEKYSPKPLPPVPPNNEKATYGLVQMRKMAYLFEVLDSLCNSSEVVHMVQPVAMESLDQMFGFLLYTTEYQVSENRSILSIAKVHDRAQIFVSCTSPNIETRPIYVGTITRWLNKELIIPYIRCSSAMRLYILVENMGRVNYGPYLYDKKGILSSVLLDGSILHDWKMFPISLQNLDLISKYNSTMHVLDTKDEKISTYKKLKTYKGMSTSEPGFYEGHFFIKSRNLMKDTFISFIGWSKGIAFVNGFNLGRYWPILGPQCNLYVPAPLLRLGDNIIVIMEMDSPNPDLKINLVNQSDFTCGSNLQQV